MPHLLQGYNAAIIAYGQTGTGKTYTMEGALEGEQRGIIPRAVQDIFHTIQTDTAPSSRYLVRASYLQIYNEVCSPSHSHAERAKRCLPSIGAVRAGEAISDRTRCVGTCRWKAAVKSWLGPACACPCR